jgi:hypothetical protein
VAVLTPQEILTLGEEALLSADPRHSLTPTAISLSVLETSTTPLAMVPGLQQLLALQAPTPQNAIQISQLLDSLQDPSLAVRRPTTLAQRPLSTLKLGLLPQRLIPTRISLLLLNRAPITLSQTFKPVNAALQLSLALDTLPNNPVISFVPQWLSGEPLTPIALLPTAPTSFQAALLPNVATQNRRLNAAVRFLLSKDMTALDTLLQATRSEPLPQVQGQVVNLDRFNLQ